MALKRWIYSLLPEPVTFSRQKGWTRFVHPNLDDALRRARPDGVWIPGAHVEVHYDDSGTRDEPASPPFLQSEFLTPDGWSQGFGQGAWDEQERLCAIAKEVALA